MLEPRKCHAYSHGAISGSSRSAVPRASASYCSCSSRPMRSNSSASWSMPASRMKRSSSLKRLNASRSIASACAYSSINVCGRSLWPMAVSDEFAAYATRAKLRPRTGRRAPSWPTENVAALVKRALRRLDTCLADHARPLFLLGAHESGKFLRRISGGERAAGAQLLAYFRRVVGAHQLAVQRLHDSGGRARRHEDAVPGDRLELRHAELGDARYRGQDVEPLAPHHRERAQLAGANRGEHHLRHDERGAQLPADQVGQLGIHALIRHLEQLDAALGPQHLADQLADAARTVRRVGELVRICLR